MAEAQVAQIIVDSLYAAGVRVVFGIPGAKIDAIFDTLQDHPEIKLIVCRHEQNAAMMAAAMGRITGIPGVCIATSGPGASNLATGLVTATTEGDPVVALIGSVPRLMNTKRTHQSMKALEILGPTAKAATGIDVEDQAAEIILSAFRTASSSPKGAAVVSIPADVARLKSKILPFPSAAFAAPRYGPAPTSQLSAVIDMIQNAKHPVLYLGMRASSPLVVSAVRSLLTKFPIPTVETFQAAGAVSRELAHLFYGRVGLFHNQAGDKLLARSDCVLAIGYDPVEYDANVWNPDGKLPVVHVDYTPSDYGQHYHPTIELLGSIVENVNHIATHLQSTADQQGSSFLKSLQSQHTAWRSRPELLATSGPVHPLLFVSKLQSLLADTTTVTVDVGTVYIYMLRFFYSYAPRTLLCSNGQQTLGVGLPWAIAASLAQSPPASAKVVSLSGDGGFMFSSQELSTAVQQKCNITHFVWNDEAYNMVEFQEEMKYGRSSGVRLGGVDFVRFAEAFGAKGFRVEDVSQLDGVMREALQWEGVSVVDVRVDYRGNVELAKHVIEDEWN
ncbi:acetolactate synthase, catabolic [Cyphellophora europaea CBS 101466]|uniref:Acetolactate synthase, catabolic n=1 Tax=Cyphellophora europaea (strain CBS 101466) TaxID=1220924 RepID=W2RPI2_CYPE1|nr:acetolactate synthase, catabolic [Cyphellophora europaea CBS 101466]ETN38235.1 acetolactate synthase, catabolic [Cyphellophora europaea CBS 101466]